MDVELLGVYWTMRSSRSAESGDEGIDDGPCAPGFQVARPPPDLHEVRPRAKVSIQEPSSN